MPTFRCILEREANDVISCPSFHIIRTDGVIQQLLRQEYLDSVVVLANTPRALHEHILFERGKVKGLFTLTRLTVIFADRSCLVL